MTEVRIASTVTPHVRAAIIEASGVAVVKHDPRLWGEIEAAVGRMRDAYAGLEPSQIEGLRPARDLYHRIGVDPTKLRPSSEALLRRVLRGDSLPQINSLVDINNWCSLEFLLPIGLHDAGRVVGSLVLRRGEPGEGYGAIGKGWYGVEGRLVAADDRGPCGSPTSDSQRTMITPETTRCLMIVYAPGQFDAPALETHAATAASRITLYAGGEIVQTAVL